MANISLSKQDIDYIARVVDTEVPRGLAKAHPSQYSAMVKAVVDTITNRVVSPQFPSTVKDVINQNRQFSKIAGPAKLNPYGSVQKAPKASSKTFGIVSDHLAARAKGAPSSIGGSVNYANPYYTDKKNMGWVKSMIDDGAVKVGVGKAVHYHGLAPGFKAAPSYSVALADDNDPFDPGGLIAPKPGGLLVSAAVAAPMKASAKDIAAAGYQQAANSMKSGGVKGVGGGLLSAAPTASAPAIGASATGKANIGVTSPGVGQKAVIGATGIMTSQQPSAIGNATVNLGKQTAPAVAMPTQAPISMPTAPISKPAAPISMPVTAPIAAPVAAPLAKAVQQAAPVARTAPVQAVQQQAPAQSFGPPMGTALGVWNGTAPVGIANNGSVLSAHNGNVYSYSPTYDRTTISTHAGDVIGSFKGKQQDTSGLLGDTQTKAGGLLSGAMGKLGGMFDGKGSQFGDKARSAAGTIAGGLLGSYVAGPVGSAIGAALGRELAKGNNPLNGGLKGVLSAATGHGSFPSAPAAPSQTANFGNGGVAGGQATWGGLSQTAKDAVSAGKGGLY